MKKEILTLFKEMCKKGKEDTLRNAKSKKFIDIHYERKGFHISEIDNDNGMCNLDYNY